MSYEIRARKFLERQGLVCVAHNFRCRFGEIDLVMREHDTLCFVEVKFRRSLAFGGAAYSIAAQKRRRLIKSAQCFLAARRRLAGMALRFDALLIQRQADGSEVIDWIPDAFSSDS